MAQGSQCTNENANSRASSLVNFICDSSVPGSGSPQLVGSLPPGEEDAACAFIIEWKTPVSVSVFLSKKGGSVELTLFIFLLSVCLWDIRIRGLLEILHGSHSNVRLLRHQKHTHTH